MCYLTSENMMDQFGDTECKIDFERSCSLHHTVILWDICDIYYIKKQISRNQIRECVLNKGNV